MASVKNATRTRGRPFTDGNPGRPKGSQNKITKRVIEESRTAFASLVKDVINHIKTHLKAHSGVQDCATCRHCWDVVLERYYGKVTQRHEIDYPTEAERLLRDLGIDATPEAVAGVIDLARERDRRAG